MTIGDAPPLFFFFFGLFGYFVCPLLDNKLMNLCSALYIQHLV